MADDHDRHLQFVNCRLFRDGKLVEDDLWVTDGVIVDGQSCFYTSRTQATRVVDCKGKILAPGFIDLQLNGGYGIDFSSPPNGDLETAIKDVAKKLLATGTTLFCPTLISSSADTYSSLLPQIKTCAGGPHGAGVLGAHLEGPFIAPKKKGAHNISHIESCQKQFALVPGAPDDADDESGQNDAPVESPLLTVFSPERLELAKQYLVATYGTLDHTSIVTLAPELPYAQEMIKILTDMNIRASLGHSLSSLADAENGVRAGATLITHLFNAMAAFHHRDPGIVGLLGSNNCTRPFYGLIADGYHTHSSAIRVAFNSHPTGLVLVTDATAAMGLGPGKHRLGDIQVEISEENKVTVYGHPETLAGSATSMISSVKNLADIVGVCPALDAATLHPAKVMGVADKKGSLKIGMDADLVMLDDDFNLHATYIAGQICWARDDHKAAWFFAKPPLQLESRPVKRMSLYTTPTRPSHPPLPMHTR